MLKNKITTSLLSSLVALVVLAAPVSAFTPTIMTLPSYINNNSFKLSCTASGTSAQFYFRKEGGSYSAFGSALDLTTTSCLVQVSSSEVNDQTKYYFKVIVDGVESSETSTTYDTNGPGNVSGYYKDGLGDGFRLHYHTPSDSDFDKVIIYRGDTSGFSADSSHEIATINSSTNSDMTYEDHFGVVAGKTYYYVIRALDHAGNSSGLVGDSETTTTTSTVTTGNVLGASTKTSSKVTQLPKEGSVLGSENTPSSEPSAVSTTASEEATAKTGLFNWISSHKKISLGVLALLALVFYFLKTSKK